ncbi:Ceramide synthase 6, partial [Orchesella cincta]
TLASQNSSASGLLRLDMTAVLSSFLEHFWCPEFWLPPGITWDDIRPDQDTGVNYPIFGDAFYAIPLAICMISIRFLVERTFLIPWGNWLGVGEISPPKSSIVPSPVINVELTNAYRKSGGKLAQDELESLSKRTDMDIRQIERWMRQTRAAFHKRSKLGKFCECGWRCICYTFSFSFGLFVMWDKPWFWDLKLCWYDYPHQCSKRCLVVLSLWRKLLLQFTPNQVFIDTKRKDFWEMLVHHVVTIFLIGFSWTCNLIRIGTVVLLVHDCADIFLEIDLLKGFLQFSCSLGSSPGSGFIHFMCFTVSYSTLPTSCPHFLPHFGCCGLLIILQILHVFWTYFVVKVVVNIFTSKREQFWSPDFWLPPGTSWEDVQPSEDKGLNYPNYKDAFYAIPLAICMVYIRRLVERTFLIKWGNWLGVGQKNPVKSNIAPPNEDLTQAYKKTGGRLRQDELESLSKRTDMDIRQLERWMRQTRADFRNQSKLTKFCECGWRCICYIFSFSFGLFVMWDKPWFWDLKHCWYDYPHHSVSNDVWWYYLFGGSYYCCLFITQAFIDAKRKDFWEMLVHHVVTIFLLGFSWICNLIRIGTFILILHDCADIFLEGMKMSLYANKDRLGERIFAVFILIWVVTRLVIYPFYVLHSFIFEAPKIMATFPAYWMLFGLLFVLQILHIFWTFFIVKAVIKICTASGKKVEDWFWSPDFWLPPGISWEFIEPNENKAVKYPNYKDVFYAIPLAICMICIRRLVERMFLIPLGQKLCVGQKNSTKSRISPPNHNEELLNAFKSSGGKLSQNELASLAKRTDMDTRRIERWMRQTRAVFHKQAKLTKFCECGWRCLCYTFSFTFGLFSVPDDVWWYYLFAGGYYCSLLLSLQFDAKRKDFWEMLLHHLVSILLLGFSWVCNFVRIGTVVLVLHDCVDIFLEVNDGGAKMSKYANNERLAEKIFAVFILLWIITRLGLYPFYVLHGIFFEAPKITNTAFPAFWLFGVWLLLLQFLHIFWTYFIIKIVLDIVLSGKTQDARSCSESLSEVSNDDNNPLPS